MSAGYHEPRPGYYRLSVNLYNQKYDWNLDPQNLPGPFYAVHPQVAFGWYFDESELNPESSGLETATRWRFKQYSDNSSS